MEVCDAFKDDYSGTGEEIGRVVVPIKSVSKKKEITQLVKMKPDFVVAVFNSAECETFFNDYYRFKVHKKFPALTIGGCVSPKRLRVYEKTLEKYDTGVNLFASSSYDSNIDNPLNHNFTESYKQTYGELPNFAGMRAYDAGRLLVKALHQLQGKWDGKKVIQLMKTIPYKSPRHGQLIKFDTHGDVMNGAIIVQTKRDGNRLIREIIYQVPPINMDEMLK